MTIFLGNYSVASECMHRLKELMDLFSRLGGLQQMGTGPNPVDAEIARQECDKYDRDAKMFIYQLFRGLLDENDWEIKIKKVKK